MRIFASNLDPTLTFLSGLRRRRRSLLSSALKGAVLGAALVWLSMFVQIVAANNFREVQPGRVYRSGQLSPERLTQVLKSRNIRTVVNLRGHCPDFDWYEAECRVTYTSDVSQEDVTLSAIRLPAPSEIRRLLDVLDRSEYPILLHCRQGVDRTGLASVVVKLLEPGTTFAQARSQLGLAFGYVPYNGTENMRRFVDLYSEWLARLECAHAPELFRYWACHEYCPGPCRGRLELLESPSSSWPAERGQMIHVRAHNDSIEHWRLWPGTHHGIHVRYRVASADDDSIFFDGRAGLFDAEVRRGSFIDLELGVPALPPGAYRLTADLIAAEGNAFCQFGGEILTLLFRVEP